MGVRLPAEYQEVEYLESTGTQYIDTGINLESNDFEINCDFVNTANVTQEQAIFSIWRSEYNYWNCFIVNNHLRVYTGAHNENSETITIGKKYSTVVRREESTWSLSLNDTTITWNYSPGSINPTTLKVFTRGDTPVIASSNSHLDIYRFLVKVNGETIASYIPCYRKSDSKPGMYDLVSKAFFINQGTDEFLVGPDVVNHISPRLMDRRRALIAKLTSLFRKVITSQTGLVSFDTNVAKPMKVTCEFSPKQDLHGYDNPWPAGGGKNLWESGDCTVNGALRVLNLDKPIVAGRYVISGVVTSTDTDHTTCLVAFYSSNTTNITSVQIGRSINNARVSAGFTLSEDCYKIYLYSAAGASGGTGDTAEYKNMQIEAGASSTSYAPYENVCPISGWTGTNVEQREINLFDQDTIYSAFRQQDGSFFGKANTFSGVRFAIPTWLVGKQLTWSVYIKIPSGSTAINPRVLAMIGGNQVNGNFISSADYTRSIVSFTPTSTEDYICVSYGSGGSQNIQLKDCQLEVGSTASAFESYHDQTIPIPFNNPGTYDFLPIQEGTGDPSSENIRPINFGLTFARDNGNSRLVCGGALTVNVDGTGTITQTMWLTSISTVTGRSESDAGYFWYTTATAIPAIKTDSAGLICDRLRVTGNIGDSSKEGYITFYANGIIRWKEEGSMTLEEYQAYLREHPLYIAYETVVPSTYTLSVAETSRAFEALGLGKNLGPLYGGTVTINEDGSVDVVSKVVKKRVTSDIGTIHFNSDRVRYTIADMLPIGSNIAISNDNYSCNMFPKVTGTTPPGIVFTENSNSTIAYILFRKTDSFGITNTLEAWNTFITENDVIVTYMLVTPQTYHFSSISELQSFLGINNVWSDLNGAITIEYYKKQQ